MFIYIALLRGINVSGHNIIKMVDLRQLCTELGFENVTTYIQSGNVIFQSKEKNTSKIENNIKKAIRQSFGYDLKVLVITKNELETIFKSNPYLEKSTIDITKLCVTFLRNNPKKDALAQIEEIAHKSDDEFVVINKNIYLHCPTGFARTKLTNNLFERKLQTDATTRNWKTITKLVELSNL